MEKLESLSTFGGKVKWCSPYEKQYGSLKKIKNRITIYIPTISLPDMHPKELKAVTQTDIYTRTLIAAIVT